MKRRDFLKTATVAGAAAAATSTFATPSLSQGRKKMVVVST